MPGDQRKYDDKVLRKKEGPWKRLDGEEQKILFYAVEMLRKEIKEEGTPEWIEEDLGGKLTFKEVDDLCGKIVLAYAVILG